MLTTMVSILLAGVLATGIGAVIILSRHHGQKVDWKLSNGKSTSIISNERLAYLQTSDEQGGILRTNDLVVVWAQQFLDDDVLYPTVAQNIRHGVRYLYILDRAHIDRFERLLESLKKDIPEASTVAKGIDVVFVSPELAANNFVLMAAETDRQLGYSALIYDRRPFAWLQESAPRARHHLQITKRIVANLGLLQYLENTPADENLQRLAKENDLFQTGEDAQLMNFRMLGQRIAADSPRTLAEYDFDLRREVGETILPEGAGEQIYRMRDYAREVS